MCHKLATLAEDFAQCRSKMTTGRYSQTLWDRAVELCKQHPIRKVAKVLGVNKNSLYRRLEPQKLESSSSPFIPIRISELHESSQSVKIHIGGKVPITIEFSRSTEELAKLVLSIEGGLQC
jgi:hypothetical protein